MTALVSVAQMRSRLRLDDAFEDDELEAVAQEASDIVTDYCKRLGKPWFEAMVPAHVQTAILLVCRNIIDATEEPLSEAVKNLLHRDRDPALA